MTKNYLAWRNINGRLYSAFAFVWRFWTGGALYILVNSSHYQQVKQLRDMTWRRRLVLSYVLMRKTRTAGNVGYRRGCTGKPVNRCHSLFYGRLVFASRCYHFSLNHFIGGDGIDI